MLLNSLFNINLATSTFWSNNWGVLHSDHYPFGSIVESRSWKGDYRYGFNGQEKADEIAGAGNLYTAPFWEYDPRAVHRWNLDPKPNPSFSPFAINQCNPIWFSDLLGDTVKVQGSKRFVRQTEKSLGKIKNTEEGVSLFNKLHNATNVYTIRQHTSNVTKVDEDSELPNNWSVGDIGITGERFSKGFDFGKRGWLSLGHEMSHAADAEDGAVSNETWQTPDRTFQYKEVVQNLNGTFSYGSTITRNVSPILVDEVRAVDRENKMRAQSGMPLRTHYNNVFIRSASVPDGQSTTIKIPTQRLVENGIGTHPHYNTNYNLLRR